MSNNKVTKKTSFKVYIDESGDEGFRFHRGSSKWFVLSGVITRSINDLETVKLVDEVRTLLNKPEKKPLHFRDLRHEQKIPYIDKIAKSRVRIVSVCIHKPSIKEPEKFQERYNLYFYSVRYLFERVSWLCRDHKTKDDKGDGTAEIIFSNRSGMSYDELKKYLRVLKETSKTKDVRIDWSVIKEDQMKSYSSGKRMGLQIADAVASGFFFALNATQYGHVEPRYAKMLKPVVYHHRGSFFGYGLKFWPRETDDILKSDSNLEWLWEEYQ